MKKPIYALLRPFNAVFARQPSWRHRPAFYDPVAVCPELVTLERNFPVIRREYLRIRGGLHQLPNYHEVDRMQSRISQSDMPGANWKVFFLEAMGRKLQRNRALCPQTSCLIDAIPNVFQACFSILEGGKSIPSHKSPYAGYLRYHLAVEVPGDVPPRMRVKDQWVCWQEGSGFLFDDTHEHEIWNQSHQIRSVLIVDIHRPMAPFAAAVNRTAIRLMRHTYARVLAVRGKILD
jgi:aspartyl/asparaginyl beta-hydroxylase (cupin superfamily)